MRLATIEAEAANVINRITTPPVNVVCLRHGEDFYVFGYQDNQFNEVLRRFGLMAADPDLNFSWHDAGALCRKVREQMRSADDAKPNL